MPKIPAIFLPCSISGFITNLSIFHYNHCFGLMFSIFYGHAICWAKDERERGRERKITPATNHPKNFNEKFLCWFHGHSTCVSVRENVLLIWIYFQIHTKINLAHDSKSVAKLCVSNNKWTHELCSHTPIHSLSHSPIGQRI